MKPATARAPLQRTTSGGISLATLNANTAGWRSQADTTRRTASRASARSGAESRKQSCWPHGMSMRTLSWCASARSKNQRGGA